MSYVKVKALANRYNKNPEKYIKSIKTIKLPNTMSFKQARELDAHFQEHDTIPSGYLFAGMIPEGHTVIDVEYYPGHNGRGEVELVCLPAEKPKERRIAIPASMRLNVISRIIEWYDHDKRLPTDLDIISHIPEGYKLVKMEIGIVVLGKCDLILVCEKVEEPIEITDMTIHSVELISGSNGHCAAEFKDIVYPTKTIGEKAVITIADVVKISIDDSGGHDGKDESVLCICLVKNGSIQHLESFVGEEAEKAYDKLALLKGENEDVK